MNFEKFILIKYIIIIIIIILNYLQESAIVIDGGLNKFTSMFTSFKDIINIIKIYYTILFSWSLDAVKILTCYNELVRFF